MTDQPLPLDQPVPTDQPGPTDPATVTAAQPTWPGPVRTGEAAGVTCVDVDRGDWVASVRAARDAGYHVFDWLTAVDESDGAHGEAGFDVVTHLARLRPFGRLLLRTRVPAGAGAGDRPSLDSLTGVFAGAAWHERETWEMFGIGFDGFDDGTGEGLRPLLLPDGFEGTPLRKSFVLAARAAKPWPGAKDPGESEDQHAKSPSRRKTLPPGVPDASWGPRRACAAPTRDDAAAPSADAGGEPGA